MMNQILIVSVISTFLLITSAPTWAQIQSHNDSVYVLFDRSLDNYRFTDNSVRKNETVFKRFRYYITVHKEEYSFSHSPKPMDYLKSVDRFDLEVDILERDTSFLKEIRLYDNSWFQSSHSSTIENTLQAREGLCYPKVFVIDKADIDDGDNRIRLVQVIFYPPDRE